MLEHNPSNWNNDMSHNDAIKNYPSLHDMPIKTVSISSVTLNIIRESMINNITPLKTIIALLKDEQYGKLNDIQIKKLQTSMSVVDELVLGIDSITAEDISFLNLMISKKLHSSR